MRIEASGAIPPLKGKPNEDHHLLYAQGRPKGQTARPCDGTWVRSGNSNTDPDGTPRRRPALHRRCPTAEHGRRLIEVQRTGSQPDIGAPPTKTVSAEGRIVALGLNAMQALAGASEAIRHWEARLARDGQVRLRDTTALGKRSDGITPSLVDYFGDGLAKTGR